MAVFSVSKTGYLSKQNEREKYEMWGEGEVGQAW
jgi:hypothetical protein